MSTYISEPQSRVSKEGYGRHANPLSSPPRQQVQQLQIYVLHRLKLLFAGRIMCGVILERIGNQFYVEIRRAVILRRRAGHY